MTDAGTRPSLFSVYRDRHVLVVGGTGFLGSVVLSLLMRELPSLARLDILVRRRPGLSAQRRFDERILPDEAFDPVRERLGDGLDALVRDRVRVLEGDLSEPRLGLDDGTLQALEGSLDLVINASGLVDFHAPLGRSYRTNVLGTEHLLELCARTGARLVHTSTAFVSGTRTGRIPEDVEVGWFPKRGEVPHLRFDPQAEIADIQAELERIDAEMESPALRAELAREAATAHRDLHEVDPTEVQQRAAIRRELRDRRKDREVAAGRARAEAWGWPNVYTYSKSLGEQRIAASDVPATIVRPTIVESALRYPEPGWNRNATTSAPLILLALSGFRPVATDPDHVIDIIPVDQVAWTLLAGGAALLRGEVPLVHHAGSSDRNPLPMRRLVDLVGIYLHEQALEEEDGAAALLRANREPRVIEPAVLERRARWARVIAARLEASAGRWSDRVRDRQIRDLLEGVRERAGKTGRKIDRALKLWDIFLPFAYELEYRFDTLNTAALARRFEPEPDEPVFRPEAIDWRSYVLDVHIPGLRRWVFTEDNKSGRTVRTGRTSQPLPERVRALGEADAFRRAASYPTATTPYAVTFRQAWELSDTLRAELEARRADLSGARIAVATAPDVPWWLGLLGVVSAGGCAVVVGSGAETAPDGSVGLLRVTGDRTARWSPAAGPEEAITLVPREVQRDPIAGGTVAFADPADGSGGRAVPLGTLAARLAELAERAGLTTVRRVVMPTEAADAGEERALALLALVLLDEGVGAECVPLAELVKTVDTSDPLAVVASESAWAELCGTPDAGVPAALRCVIDLSPRGEQRLRPWLRAGAEVAQLLPDPAGAGFAALRRVRKPADLELAYEPVAPYRLAASRGRLEVAAGAGDAVPVEGWHAEPRPETDGVRVRALHPRPGESVLLEEIFRTARVERAEVREAGRRGGVRLLVSPEPEGTRTLQQLRRDLLRDVVRHNEGATRAERIVACAVTLDGEVPATDPGWIPTRTRDEIDAVPPLAERAAWSEAILAQVVPPAALELYRSVLHEAPLSEHRLEAWERVILDGVARGDLHPQAFVQAFGDEAGRQARPDLRTVRGVRGVLDSVRDWTGRPDPAEPLLPDAVTAPARAAIGASIRAFYRYGMKVTLRGGAYVPPHQNFLVVANHSSHLDGGLVKYALGAWGERVHALAAKDYFFGTPARRFLAHHFTRLIPTERTRVTSEWLRKAKEVIAHGDCVLIFPEGTRTPGSEVEEFKASLGTLVRTLRVPVLPIMIEGTAGVLPKGKAIPRGREATVHVGPPMEWEVFERGLEAGATLKHDRWIAETIRRAVVSLPEGGFWWVAPSDAGGERGPGSTTDDGPRAEDDVQEAEG